MLQAFCFDEILKEYAPPNWAEQIIDMSHSGRHIYKQGGGPGSLEPAETAHLDYLVTTFPKIKKELPWLVRFYESPEVLTIVSVAIGVPVYPCAYSAAININLLRGSGKRYELHEDGEGVTLVLFAHDMNRQGGELIVHEDIRIQGRVITAWRNIIEPKKGWGLPFDGCKHPHEVAPLTADVERVTVPMMYYSEPQPDSNDDEDEWKDYLYEK